MFDTSSLIPRATRVIGGLAVSSSLLALAGLLGFMGSWTYEGYKTPGDPTMGSLLLAGAVGSFSAGVMALVFAVTNRRISETRGFGAIAAVVGLGCIIWFTSTA